MESSPPHPSEARAHLGGRPPHHRRWASNSLAWPSIRPRSAAASRPSAPRLSRPPRGVTVRRALEAPRRASRSRAALDRLLPNGARRRCSREPRWRSRRRRRGGVRERRGRRRGQTLPRGRPGGEQRGRSVRRRVPRPRRPRWRHELRAVDLEHRPRHGHLRNAGHVRRGAEPRLHPSACVGAGACPDRRARRRRLWLRFDGHGGRHEAGVRRDPRERRRHDGALAQFSRGDDERHSTPGSGRRIGAGVRDRRQREYAGPHRYVGSRRHAGSRASSSWA